MAANKSESSAAMSRRAVMRSALLVSGTEKGKQTVKGLLNKTVYRDITTADSGAQARRMLMTGDYDTVVINTPLSDEFGHELSIYAAELGAGCILLVKNEIFNEICDKVEAYGIMTVGKPFSAQMFYQVIRLTVSMQNRIQAFQAEKRKLQTKMEEMRVISRAKCILVEYLRMNETQAHKYIERQAMDMREPKVKIAEGILKTYDTQI